MNLIEVKDNYTRKEFLEFPVRLYKDDPNWIRPLDKDIEEVFDPEKNKFFRHGEAIRWILQKDGKTIGRVAAFINKKTANTFDQPTGGMGFFECIHDKEAANMLFDAAKKWNENQGMEAMDGPINFGERDRWWGLLVDGFLEPNYCMYYHFPYYRKFFEDYGFKTYFEQYTYSMPVDSKLPESYREKADRIAKNPAYHFEHISKKHLKKYAEDFRTIYNKAWVKHTVGTKTMAEAQAMSIMKKIKPVLDEDICWFAYYNNEPVGFFIILPELNQIFKYLNGKFDLIAKLKFLYYKWRGVCRKMFGVAFGIVPEHQGKGLEGALVMAAAKKIQPLNRYDVFEMNWIGDFNPKMLHICDAVGAKVVKTHITYRLLFDPNKEFKRAPVIE